MTLLRRAAVRVAGFTVRHASAGSREWAEGLAREVEVIGSDWRALAWALGSLRVLLRSSPQPLRDAAEIARAGRLFAGAREHVPPVQLMLMVLMAFDYGYRAAFPTRSMDSLQRGGYAVAAVSALYMGVVAWMAGRMHKRPEDMDDGAWIAFYRAEMERLRDLYAGFGTLFLPAVFLFMAGGAFGAWGEHPYLISWLVVPWAWLMWRNPAPAQRFQRKMNDVDSILVLGRENA